MCRMARGARVVPHTSDVIVTEGDTGDSSALVDFETAEELHERLQAGMHVGPQGPVEWCMAVLPCFWECKKTEDPMELHAWCPELEGCIFACCVSNCPCPMFDPNRPLVSST